MFVCVCVCVCVCLCVMGGRGGSDWEGGYAGIKRSKTRDDTDVDISFVYNRIMGLRIDDHTYREKT